MYVLSTLSCITKDLTKNRSRGTVYPKGIVSEKEPQRKKGTNTMALSKAKIREILSEAGVDSEKMAVAVDKITDGHVASIDALKEDRDKYKQDAEKLADVQKELDDLKATVDDDNGFKEKYENIKKEYNDYKQAQSEAAAKKAKDDAYRALLKDIGVVEKRIDAVMKVTSLDDLKLDKDGKLENIDTLKESAKNEWADFIGKPDTKGAPDPKPPANDPKPPRTESRAAQLEKQYHGDIYGEAPKSNE